MAGVAESAPQHAAHPGTVSRPWTKAESLLPDSHAGAHKRTSPKTCKTCFTRERLDGDGAARRHSQTDQRSWRLSTEQPGLRDEGESRTITSQILLQQPRHRRHWEIQGDLRDRNNSPKDTFGVRSAVQTPLLTKHPPTTASCNTWEKNTGDSNCFQKALDSCAILTGQPAWTVVVSDGNCATAAACATATQHSESFVLAKPFRTDDNPDIRVQRKVVRPPISNLLKAHRRCPQVTLLTTAPAKLSHSDITLAERDKQVLVELRLVSAMALPRCLVSQHATAWDEWSPVLGRAVPLPLSPAPC